MPPAWTLRPGSWATAQRSVPMISASGSDTWYEAHMLVCTVNRSVGKRRWERRPSGISEKSVNRSGKALARGHDRIGDGHDVQGHVAVVGVDDGLDRVAYVVDAAVGQLGADLQPLVSALWE